MDVVKEMIYKALRDDSAATVGIRALLSQAATPYGVYHANLPDNVDFTSNKKYIVYFQGPSDYDKTYPRHNLATVVKEETYQITAWGGNATTSNDKILDRVKHLLEGKHKTTNPTTDAEVYQIRCEWEGPDLWDDDYKTYYKSTRYRVWVRDDTVT